MATPDLGRIINIVCSMWGDSHRPSDNFTVLDSENKKVADAVSVHDLLFISCDCSGIGRVYIRVSRDWHIELIKFEFEGMLVEFTDGVFAFDGRAVVCNELDFSDLSGATARAVNSIIAYDELCAEAARIDDVSSRYHSLIALHGRDGAIALLEQAAQAYGVIA